MLFGGCFCSFWVFFVCFSRVSAKNFWVYFSRWAKQSREFPLWASARRQHPENQRKPENQAGRSPERTAEGQSGEPVRHLAPGREDDHKKVQITIIIVTKPPPARAAAPCQIGISGFATAPPASHAKTAQDFCGHHHAACARRPLAHASPRRKLRAHCAQHRTPRAVPRASRGTWSRLLILHGQPEEGRTTTTGAPLRFGSFAK